MKKGLITAVGTILLAIAGRGYANAPTISNVPDIIISDKEDNVGATVDQNFFRYLNAFNILDYAKDTDSTPAQMLFAFKEQTNVNNLTINGVSQLPNTTTLPSAWGAAKINTSASYGFWFSFRDILRSPGTGSGPFSNPLDASGNPVGSTTAAVLPWSTTSSSTLAGTSRQVTIFAADEADNVASDVINVYSVNAPLGDANAQGDGLSGTFTPVMTDNTFLAADWVWTQYTFTSYAPAASTGGAGAGFLGLTSGANAGAAKSGAYYARWITANSGASQLVAKIPFAEGNVIYCAKLQLQLTAAQSNVKAQAPDLRFGSENRLQQFTTQNLLIAQTFGQAGAPDSYNPHLPAVGGAAKEYRVYWSQNQNARGYDVLANYDLGGGNIVDLRKWNVFFEIVDVDTNNASLEDSGTWRLNSIVIGTLPRPADLATGNTNKISITNFTSTNGWAAGSYAGIGNASVAQNSPSAGKITFNANAAITGTTTAVLWEKSAVVSWQAGKVIRAVANLSCPTEANRSTFAMARIRHQTVGPWVAQVWILARNDASASVANTLMPDTTANGGTNYEVYIPSYGGPSSALSVLANYDKFNAAFDHIQRTGTDAATSWVVNSLQYEILDDPLGA